MREGNVRVEGRKGKEEELHFEREKSRLEL